MKVKVIKASKPSFWYADKIGQEFEVEEYKTNKNLYLVVGNGIILKSDCIPVPTRITSPSLDFLLSLKHGQRVNVSIEGTECEAVVNAKEDFYGNKAVFLCQDLRQGTCCKNKMGKLYSWCIDAYNYDYIKWIELLGAKPICTEEELIFDFSSVTVTTEEVVTFTETFTEDEQALIELFDKLLEQLLTK